MESCSLSSTHAPCYNTPTHSYTHHSHTPHISPKHHAHTHILPLQPPLYTYQAGLPLSLSLSHTINFINIWLKIFEKEKNPWNRIFLRLGFGIQLNNWGNISVILQCIERLWPKSTRRVCDSAQCKICIIETVFSGYILENCLFCWNVYVISCYLHYFGENCQESYS